MLWRAGYDTKRLGEIALPERIDAPDGTVLILVGGVRALAGFGVLVRLCDEEFGPNAWYGILVGDERAYRETLAPSRFAQSMVVAKADVEDGATVCGVIQGDRLKSAIAGPATEEAWDEIVAARSAITG